MVIKKNQLLTDKHGEFHKHMDDQGLLCPHLNFWIILFTGRANTGKTPCWGRKSEMVIVVGEKRGSLLRALSKFDVLTMVAVTGARYRLPSWMLEVSAFCRM